LVVISTFCQKQSAVTYCDYSDAILLKHTNLHT